MLQILLCMGIVGLVVFAVAIFLSIQKSLEYIKTENNVKSSIYVIAVIVSLISALIIGAFDYIWYNPRIFYLFWIIAAIGGAYVRVGDSERARCEDFEHDLY